MKKLFASILVLAMLCAFGAVGASARPATEEETALARQYLEETAAIINSNRYTFEGISLISGGALATPSWHPGSLGFVEVRDGDRIALVKIEPQNCFERVAYGMNLIVARYPDKTQRIFPERRCYVEIPEENEIRNRPELELISILGSIDANPVVTVNESSSGTISMRMLDVTYRDGKLSEVMMTRVEELSATPDESFFSTEGMWKMPLWLYNAINQTTSFLFWTPVFQAISGFIDDIYLEIRWRQNN